MNKNHTKYLQKVIENGLDDEKKLTLHLAEMLLALKIKQVVATFHSAHEFDFFQREI
jgi:hypothetical protein